MLSVQETGHGNVSTLLSSHPSLQYLDITPPMQADHPEQLHCDTQPGGLGAFGDTMVKVCVAPTEV
jgi:hypothetical protein